MKVNTQRVVYVLVLLRVSAFMKTPPSSIKHDTETPLFIQTAPTGEKGKA